MDHLQQIREAIHQHIGSADERENVDKLIDLIQELIDERIASAVEDIADRIEDALGARP